MNKPWCKQQHVIRPCKEAFILMAVHIIKILARASRVMNSILNYSELLYSVNFAVRDPFSV